MKIPVTVQGVTVHQSGVHSDVFSLYLAGEWLGNISVKSASVEIISGKLDKYSDLFSQIALALSVAPEAEWTIRTFSPNDYRYTFGERAYATEIEAREAFQRAVMSNEENGGGAELRFKGVKVERHSAFARNE